MQQIKNSFKQKSVPHLEHFYILNQILVRERGLEPPQPCGHYHLKVARLPIPPLAHVPGYFTGFGTKTQDRIGAGIFRRILLAAG